ncbi:hypothetical protein [Pseudohalioglobus lutimaris]
MAISQDDQVIPTSPGARLSYALQIENTGNQNATGVVIRETVPVGATYLAASSDPGWSCLDGDIAGRVCTLAVGDPRPPRRALASVHCRRPGSSRYGSCCRC